MKNFEINMDDKPHLTNLMNTDVDSFREVVGTFVALMETAAEKKWTDLPGAIHTSLSFKDVITGVLNAVMTTREIDEKAFNALDMDLHPLSLLSDQHKNLVTGEKEPYEWKSHFSLDSNEISRETLEHIIRKMLYLMRWFDVESVSKALITQTFPVIDAKDVRKLPFQPALRYQQDELGTLHVGKFFHDIGAFNCGEIDHEEKWCLACNTGRVFEPIENYKVCPRCNAGFTIKEE